MKPQSLIRAKRVGKNKYNYDIGSYEDFERMVDENNEIDKHSIKQILKDVIEDFIPFDDAFQKALREIGGTMAKFEGTFVNQRNRVLGIEA